ncbi:hypothetical protein [Ralstonia sp. ASV6]|uniref:hypothetical protein n=1 Tax=Ralstonia sp. ASV6 TaxID=2795124 RepID=UPI0018EA63D9|nr:hypothetical protein [Ralstonia sp. ASV6]
MDIAALIDTVTGYGNGFDRAIKDSGLTAAALRKLLISHNVEQCPSCHWYVDSHELLDEDSRVDGHCDNCRHIEMQGN